MLGCMMQITHSRSYMWATSFELRLREHGLRRVSRLSSCSPVSPTSTTGFNQMLENSVYKKMYGKKQLTVQYWAMAYEDYIMKANFMGSVHGPCQCPYELWTGKHPDLITLPTIPFGSVRIA